MARAGRVVLGLALVVPGADGPGHLVLLTAASVGPEARILPNVASMARPATEIIVVVPELGGCGRKVSESMVVYCICLRLTPEMVPMPRVLLSR